MSKKPKTFLLMLGIQPYVELQEYTVTLLFSSWISILSYKLITYTKETYVCVYVRKFWFTEFNK